VTAAVPGYDEVVLAAPDGARLCNSLACSRAGRLAEVIVTFGVLSDPGASYHARGALWRESRGKAVPMCAACWDSCRQVAIRYRPGLAVIDLTRPPATPRPPMGRP
jgi:hypothetical protein